jgi:hypothetical protein
VRLGGDDVATSDDADQGIGCGAVARRSARGTPAGRDRLAGSTTLLDIPTGDLLQDIVDETERRIWRRFESGQGLDNTKERSRNAR